MRGKASRSTDRRVPRARRLRRDMTDAERKLWWHLRRLPIEDTHFRRQATIGPYFADFACHERRLVIEIDGGGHATAEQMAADVLRTTYLEANGYRVLRFWNHDVLKEIDAVMLAIHSVLETTAQASPPTPDPSPPQAGGGEEKRRV
jgi:very-short-patch-repair endonuclease